jgi:rubrerythrin
MTNIPNASGSELDRSADLLTRAAVNRRSFLRYTGATAVVGGLLLAGCKKDDDNTPATNNGSISGLTPDAAGVGETVTLTGTGTTFTGATKVTFNGIDATSFVVVSPTSITAVVPATATKGRIKVKLANGSELSSSTDFLVLTSVLANNDFGILNYAYALEQLEAAFYIQATATPFAGITATERATLERIRDHEIVHRDFFKAALGENRLRNLEVDFSSINFAVKASVLGAARTFEDLGVSAYNGAGQYITNPAYLTLAGKIVSVEARHASLIRDMIAPNSAVARLTVGGLPPVVNATDDIVTEQYKGTEISRKPSEVLLLANTYIKPSSRPTSNIVE